MSETRVSVGSRYTPTRRLPQRAAAFEEDRRVRPGDRLGYGTLACRRCDAPVAPPPGGLAPVDSVSCPYCGHRGAARDFLSLAAPTRAAHVVVRVR